MNAKPACLLLLTALLWAPACTKLDTSDDDSEESDRGDDDSNSGDAGPVGNDDDGNDDTRNDSIDAGSDGDDDDDDGDGDDDTSSVDGGTDPTPPAAADGGAPDPDAPDPSDPRDASSPPDDGSDPADDMVADAAVDADDPDMTDDPTTPGTTTPVEDDARATTGSLVLQVTAAQAPAVPGQRVLYAITVGNTSTLSAEGVSVLFRVPDGHQFNYATDAHPNSSSCGNNSCTSGEEATWNLGSIPASSTKTIFVSAAVLDSVGAGDTLSSFVRVSATGVNPASVTKLVPVVAAAPAELTLTASSDPVTPGQEIDLDVDVGHVGDEHLLASELALDLPESLTPTMISDGGAVDDQGRVSWPLGDFLVGSTFKRTIRATVSDASAPGDVLNPRATLVYDGEAESANVAQIPMSVVETHPPLSLVVTPAASPMVPGNRVLYQMTIANTSLRAVEGINLLLRVPAEASHNYATNADPNSSSCGNNTCSGDEEATWSIASLAAGTTETILVDPAAVETLAGDGTLVTANFALSAAGVHPIHRALTLPVQSNPSAQLSLDTAFDPVSPGQSFTYELNVGQVGEQSLFGAELRLALPDGVDVTNISDDGVVEASGPIVWNLGDLSVAATATRSVTVTAASDALPASVLQAHAVLRFEGGEEVDAVALHSVSVVEEPLPLSASFELSPTPAVLGDRILYTTTITNDSQRAIDDISLVLRVPNGLSYNYSTHADPNSTSCGNNTCSAGEESGWTLASLGAGSLQIITVNPEVARTLVGGSLVTVVQRLTAPELGGTILLRKTVPTTN